ncbi:MAG: hypothetical protein EAX87_00745 [Candidatus Thorarchaeota archaeon]|nr:hypothetical protein [Candidatus Thorarchaeota archaeon]
MNQTAKKSDSASLRTWLFMCLITFFFLIVIVLLYIFRIGGPVIFVYLAVFSIFCVFCASANANKTEESEQDKKEIPEEYQSLIPEGFRRLQMSESQKTKAADSLPRRPIPGVAHSLSRIHDVFDDEPTRRPSTRPKPQAVRVLRGGEFIGNRMRFKVKVINDSPYVITDVTVFLLAYPKESLKFVGDDDSVSFAKIEPGGFLSPTFDFLPTQDCVKGEIVAGVSFLDMHGNPQVRNTKPFIIRSVCDLLLPSRITPEDFELRLKDLECGEVSVKIEEWTPEEMFEKALRIVDESNFFEVSSKIEDTDGIAFGKITGFALGKYTNKEVGVEIDITGPVKAKGASCKIKVSGEDQAMILPAIDDLRERLNAWLCPMCSSPLSLAQVEDLKEGNAVVCSFCDVTIGR